MAWTNKMIYLVLFCTTLHQVPVCGQNVVELVTAVGNGTQTIQSGNNSTVIEGGQIKGKEGDNIVLNVKVEFTKTNQSENPVFQYGLTYDGTTVYTFEQQGTNSKSNDNTASTPFQSANEITEFTEDGGTIVLFSLSVLLDGTAHNGKVLKSKVGFGNVKTVYGSLTINVLDYVPEVPSTTKAPTENKAVKDVVKWYYFLVIVFTGLILN